MKYINLFSQLTKLNRYSKPIVAIFILATNAFISSANEFTIRIAINNAPPFRVIEENKVYGIYIDTIEEVAKRVNATLEYRVVPFSRALLMMETGIEVDMMLGPRKLPEREKYMVYLTNTSFPFAVKAFYGLVTSKPIKVYSDLLGKHIEKLRGAKYWDKFDTDTRIKIYENNKLEYGIQKVLHKRSNYILMPELEGDQLIKKLKVNLIKSPYKIIGSKPYIAISKKSSIIAKKDLIETAMKDLESEGVLEDIFMKYASELP